MRYYIYEGWAEMAPFADPVPRRARKLRKFHAYNTGAYHDWYREYVDMLVTERPELEIRLIPVARILSQLLTSPPLDEIANRDLYSDSAPHGTGTLYFLASMITYSALFDEPAPAGFTPPDSLDPLVTENYRNLADTIWRLLQTGKRAELARQPAPEKLFLASDATTGNLTSAKDTDGHVSDPKLAMGLNGVTDWSVQHPFIDLMKTARGWTGAQTRAMGRMDRQGPSPGRVSR